MIGTSGFLKPLLAYRYTVQSSTGFSPHCLMLGRVARIPIGLMVARPPGEERRSS